jgi:hypothetical protein
LNLQDVEFEADLLSGRSGRGELPRAGRAIPENSHASNGGGRLLDQLEPFPGEFWEIQELTRDVSARMGDAPHIAALDRICLEIEGEYRNDRSSGPRGFQGGGADGHEHVDLSARELCGESWEGFGLSPSEADLEDYGLTFHVAQLTQISAQGIDAPGARTRALVQNADDRNASGPPGPGGERHNGDAEAHDANGLPPLHY